MTPRQTERLERLQASIDKHYNAWCAAQDQGDAEKHHARWQKALDQLEAFYDRIDR